VVSPRRTSRTGRSRFTLVLLVLTSVTVLTLDFRGAGAVDDLRGAASTIFSPLADGASTVTEPFTDAWNGAFGYDDLEQENERLRERIAELEGNEVASADAIRQLDELADLEGISRYTAEPSVVARVVGGSLTNFENSIQLDRGSDDGVQVGMPVLTGAGLVGRVIAVTGGRSTVQLITDPGFEIGIRLARSGELGLARGTGDGEPLVVDAGIPVNVENQIRNRESVTTSGVDGSIFPADIPVGRVTSVDTAADQLSLVLTLEPVADLGELSMVRVLLWAPEATTP
jgi:rod shape-determining protein MreC